jgi:hypothetical protein
MVFCLLLKSSILNYGARAQNRPLFSSPKSAPYFKLRPEETKVLVPENRYSYLRISHNAKSSKSSNLHPAGIILNSARNSIIHHGAFACCARFSRQRSSRRARRSSSLAWKKGRALHDLYRASNATSTSTKNSNSCWNCSNLNG